MKEVIKYVSDRGREFATPEEARLDDCQTFALHIAQVFYPFTPSEEQKNILARFLSEVVNHPSRFQRKIRKLRQLYAKATTPDAIPF